MVNKNKIKHTLVDYCYTGGFNNEGVMKLVYDEDAVENALKMWLVSVQGDIVRYGGYGGYIYKALHKPMNEDTVEEVTRFIEIGLDENFTPFLQIESVLVEPDYGKKLYLIDIEGFIPAYNFKLRFSGALRSQAR